MSGVRCLPVCPVYPAVSVCERALKQVLCFLMLCASSDSELLTVPWQGPDTVCRAWKLP